MLKDVSPPAKISRVELEKDELTDGRVAGGGAGGGGDGQQYHVRSWFSEEQRHRLKVSTISN